MEILLIWKNSKISIFIADFFYLSSYGAKWTPSEGKEGKKRWKQAGLMTQFRIIKIPPHPPLLKGGEGGFSDEPTGMVLNLVSILQRR